MTGNEGHPHMGQQAAPANQQSMLLLQVSEADWAVVMLDGKSGGVRELQIDAATAQKVQAGELSPEQLEEMLAQQDEPAGGSGGEGNAS